MRRTSTCSSSFFLLGRQRRYNNKEQRNDNTIDDTNDTNIIVSASPMLRFITSIGSILFVGTLVCTVMDWNTKQKQQHFLSL